MNTQRFALTPGEPAGIGPDLCLLLASQHQPHPLIAITSCDLLSERAAQLGVDVNLLPVVPGQWPEQPAPAGSLYVWDTPLSAAVTPGVLDKANAAFVREVTGFAIGGVPPMAHAQEMTVFIDEDLMAEETLWAAAGTPNSMFPLTPALLLRLTRGQVADVKQNPSP